jgi:ATP:ADP antiporter, AAA family
MATHKGNFLFRFQNYLQIDRYDTTKLVLGAITFFFVIGSYSILRSLKTSVFLGMVGREWEPISKILTIVLTIPAMMLHAKITDSFKRHQVVYCFLGIYTVATIVFAILFAHPVYGISNTQTSPYRITGWAFELCMDLFQALIVGTFWSFLNSINTPIIAEKTYGFIVAGSRIGGITTAFVSWFFLEKTVMPGRITIPILTGCTAIFLLCAMLCIYLITRNVPAEHLHGYEAAYKIDQKQETAQEHTSVFEGLRLMLSQPYVLSIFGLVFSYEVINIIFDYQMHVLMSVETGNEITAMSSFMLLYTGSFQLLSLVFALFGTSTLVRILGVRACLLVMPIATMMLAVLPLLCPKLLMIFIVMVILRALNYGFNHPLREMLFIPTTKDIRFKSKAWIESFGRTVSKTTGSTFNYITTYLKIPYFCLATGSFLSVILSVVWTFVAIAVGRTYAKTIESNEVIGQKAK